MTRPGRSPKPRGSRRPGAASPSASTTSRVPSTSCSSLISKHKLDVTEIALSKVTDEFIAHVKNLPQTGLASDDLEETTSFLLVAATLLDLKAARLLPQGDVEDEADLALLEARDLLFARLLQYKAYKQVAAVFDARLQAESRRFPRAVGLEARCAGLLPEVLIGIGLDQFAALAARAMEPKPELELTLRPHPRPDGQRPRAGRAGGGPAAPQWDDDLPGPVGDSADTLTTVARFLSLLELFREGAVGFDQVTPLGELTVRWTGDEAVDVDDLITDEFDGGPPPAEEKNDDSEPTEEALAVPLAELRPSLEAVLMVADQPLDEIALATAVGYPAQEVTDALSALAAEYDEQGRGFELRNVAGGWRFYTREEYAAVVGGIRPRGPAGTAHAGRAGDPRGGRLPAAGVARPGLGRARCQRRRCDAHPAQPRPGRGGRPGRSSTGRRSTGRRRTSSSGSGSSPSTSCPRWPRTSPTSPRSRRSWPRPRRPGPSPPPRSRSPPMAREIAVDEDGLIRLQKLLAQSGVASRRRCEELMLDGEVEVDGEVVTRLGTKVDPRTAVIKVSGKRLPPVSEHVYLVLNKPRGVVSTMSDPEGRRTLSDFVGDRPERLFHVGRLDTDTSGLLMLTNDGDFAHRMAHPSFEVEKTYVAEVEGRLTKATVADLLAGVTLEDGSVDVRRGPDHRHRGREVDHRAGRPRGSQPDRATPSSTASATRSASSAAPASARSSWARSAAARCAS